MSVYKLHRCRNRKCTLRVEVEKPKQEKDVTDSQGKKRKSAGPCPKCGDTTYYSQKWYYTLYHKGLQRQIPAHENKLAAEDKERHAYIDRSEGKLEKKELTWEHGVKTLKSTYTRKSPKTVEMYDNSLKALNPYFADWKLHEIDKVAIQQYIAHRYSQKVGPSSVNRDLSTISRILHLRGFDLKIEKETEQGRDRFLDEQEFVRFLKAINIAVETTCDKRIRKSYKRLQMAVSIDLDTGLRLTAVMSLKKEDINFALGRIVQTEKGEKKAKIPLTSRLADALKAYMAEMDITRDEQYLFPSPHDPNKPMKSMRKTFKAVLKDAGIKDFKWHDLRRTFGAHHLYTTKNLKITSGLLGHTDINLTDRKYTPLLSDAAANSMNEFESKTSHLWQKGKDKSEQVTVH